MITLENQKPKYILHKLFFYTFGFKSIYFSYLRNDITNNIYCNLQSGIPSNFNDILLNISKKKKKIDLLFPASFTDDISAEQFEKYKKHFSKFKNNSSKTPFILKLKLNFNQINNLTEFYNQFKNFIEYTSIDKKMEYKAASIEILNTSPRNIISLMSI